ncbi:MAG: CAP domain-containing protein [Gammaproteobacteria bacterium]
MFVSILLASVISCASSTSSVAEKNIKTPPTSNFHVQFLKQVNIARSKGRRCGKTFFPAASPLILNGKLNLAAHKHSQDMFEHQFLEHVSSNGDTLLERIQKVKYGWRAVAENIAHNQKSIGQVIDDWLSSPGHCSNMMSAAYTQTGIANVNRYWTQVYATPN